MSRLLAICLLFFAIAGVQAAPSSPAVTEQDLAAFKELQQIKLDAQKELQVKDIEAVRQQITAVDKRVDDQLTQKGQAVDRFGVVVAGFGCLLTVSLVVLGLVGYRNAKSEAKEVASEVATSVSKDWFEKHSDLLLKQIQGVQERAALAHQEMEGAQQGVNERVAELKRALDNAQASIGKDKPQNLVDQEESNRVIADRDRELRAAGEDSYSFDDWNARAHAAFLAGRLEDSAYFWLKASGVVDAGASKVAQVLFNRGVAQDSLKQFKSANTTYDELLRRFDFDTEPAAREYVARALVNKAVNLGRLEKPEDELAIYEEVISRFENASESALREQVAMAIANKAAACGWMLDWDAAIENFDEVVRRFFDAPEPELQVQVEKALGGAGLARVLRAKQLLSSGRLDGQATLGALLRELNEAIECCDQSNGFLLCGRAYVHSCQGDTASAESDLSAAFRAAQSGGKRAYEATCVLLDQYPLASDVTMVELLDRAWQEYQASHDGDDGVSD